MSRSSSRVVLAFLFFGITAFSADTKVKLALNWKPEPEFGGFYEAERAKLFARENLDVEILIGGAGTPVIQMVPAGRVEFGIVGAEEAIVARERGADLVALFAVYQTNPMAIMVHESRGAKSLKEVFDSGTIALQKGLPYVNFLEKKYGFGKVKLVPYVGGISQFLTDPNFAQQCFVTAEPIAARRSGAKVKTFVIAEDGFNPYNTVVVARRSYVEKNRDVVRRFIKAVKEGWETYVANPKEANEVMAKLNATIDRAAFDEMAQVHTSFVKNADTEKLGIGAMTDARWNTLAKQMVDLGLVKKALSASDYYLPLSKVLAK